MSSFAFLSPWMWVAAAGVIGPILLHLARREERRPQGFPSLMFVPATTRPVAQRLRLRDLALLILRILCVLLLVGAFALPVWRYPANAQAGAEDIILLLDSSYSMDTEQLVAGARERVRAILANLGTADRAALVVFDSAPRVLSDLTHDHNKLAREIDLWQPGESGTRLGAALASAISMLSQRDDAQRARAARVVVISDLQKTGALDLRGREWSSDVSLQIEALEREPIANPYVLNAELDARGNGPSRLRIRVGNSGGLSINDAVLRLAVDGKEMGSETISLAPGEIKSIELETQLDPRKEQHMSISFKSDELRGDDHLDIVLPATRGITAGLVAPQRRSQSNREIDLGLRYLREAMALASNPGIKVRTITSQSGAQTASFGGLKIVVLADTALSNPRLAERLTAFIKGGGRALLFASTEPLQLSSAHPLAPSLRKLGIDASEPGRSSSWHFSPGQDGLGMTMRLVDRPYNRATIAADDAPAHLRLALPVWGASRAELQSGLRQVRVFAVKSARRQAEAGTRVLAQLSDGTPVLSEVALGAGSLSYLAVPLHVDDGTPGANNLSNEAGFAPMVHSLLKYLAEAEEIPLAYSRGEVVDLRAHLIAQERFDPWSRALAQGAKFVLNDAEGRALTVARQSSAQDLAVQLPAQGLYRVSLDVAGMTQSRPILLAGYEAREESRLGAISPDELEQMLRAAPKTEVAQEQMVNGETDGEATSVERANLLQNNLIGTLLGLLLLALLIETVWASRCDRVRLGRGSSEVIQ